MRENPVWLKPSDESAWERAKEIVAQQRHRRGGHLKPEDWALVTHIFKGMPQTSLPRTNPMHEGGPAMHHAPMHHAPMHQVACCECGCAISCSDPNCTVMCGECCSNC